MSFAFSDLKPIIDAITGVVSPTTIIAILAGITGVTIVFVLFWWGARKAASAIMAAVKKGRLKI